MFGYQQLFRIKPLKPENPKPYITQISQVGLLPVEFGLLMVCSLLVDLVYVIDMTLGLLQYAGGS